MLSHQAAIWIDLKERQKKTWMCFGVDFVCVCACKHMWKKNPLKLGLASGDDERVSQ